MSPPLLGTSPTDPPLPRPFSLAGRYSLGRRTRQPHRHRYPRFLPPLDVYLRTESPAAAVQTCPTNAKPHPPVSSENP